MHLFDTTIHLVVGFRPTDARKTPPSPSSKRKASIYSYRYLSCIPGEPAKRQVGFLPSAQWQKWPIPRASTPQFMPKPGSPWPLMGFWAFFATPPMNMPSSRHAWAHGSADEPRCHQQMHCIIAEQRGVNDHRRCNVRARVSECCEHAGWKRDTRATRRLHDLDAAHRAGALRRNAANVARTDADVLPEARVRLQACVPYSAHPSERSARRLSLPNGGE